MSPTLNLTTAGVRTTLDGETFVTSGHILNDEIDRPRLVQAFGPEVGGKWFTVYLRPTKTPRPWPYVYSDAKIYAFKTHDGEVTKVADSTFRPVALSLITQM